MSPAAPDLVVYMCGRIVSTHFTALSEGGLPSYTWGIEVPIDDEHLRAEWVVARGELAMKARRADLPEGSHLLVMGCVRERSLEDTHGGEVNESYIEAYHVGVDLDIFRSDSTLESLTGNRDD